MKIFDLSPLVNPELKVWPGDTPPSREVLCDMARGDNITLSTLRTTVHAGAHADAPSHYGVGGATIDARKLELYVGPAQVIHVAAERATRIGPEALLESVEAPRVLIATGTYPQDGAFHEDFAALAPDLVDHLHAQGVRLVGVDTPSVDLFESKDLQTHRRFLAHDMAILEGLVLDDVPAGVYELVALPLRLAGFDASPVRAILRSL